MFISPIVCYAYDIMVDIDGTLMYFNIKDESNVFLTYESRSLVFDDDSFSDYVAGYTDLSYLTIPSSIEYNGATYIVVGVESGCFQNCTFKRLNLPKTIQSIQSDISSLDTLCLEDVAVWCGVVGGSKLMSKSKEVLVDSDPLRTLDLSEAHTLTTIEAGAFKLCRTLEAVTLPSSLQYIGDEAFSGCTNLSTINIQSTDFSVGDKAFYGTSWLSNQEDGLIYIGNTAYSYKGNMNSGTTLTLRDGTSRIASFAFSGCSGLSSVVLPEGVVHIGESAFEDCTGLVNIFLPSTLRELGNAAFCNTSLLSITLPERIKVIPAYLFYSCKKLVNITLPSSLEQIGSQAFRYCSSLTTIELPSSLTSIGTSAFRNCTELENVSFDNCIPIISNYAFHQTNYYNTVDEGVVYVGTMAYCYKGTMPDNSYLTIATGTTFIADRAFINQAGIVQITLPESLARIGTNAFNGCNNISSIDSKIDNPGSCAFSTNAFTTNTYTNAQLNVPYGRKQLYAVHENWRKFRNIMEDILIGDVNDDGTVNVSDVVQLVNRLLNGEVVEYTVDDIVTCVNDILSSESEKTVDDIVIIVNNVLGNNGETFNKAAADVSGDGSINVSDIVELVNVILQQ